MFTTLAVGSRLEYNFLRGATQFSSDDDFLPISWAIRQPSRLLLGVPFSAALFLALILSRPYGHPSTLPMSLPLLFHFVWSTIGPHGGIGLGQMNLHPTAFAAWVGLLATSLNLLPGGQLDGGHIVYAIAPRLHSRATRLCSLILLPMGLFLWGGWLLWGVVLLLPVMRHPPVPQFPDMDPKRKLLGVVALLMFVLSFVPVPLGENAPWTAIKPWIARHFRATH
jgi:membrane-associated protease RseP (regulator of RpoE activity)